MSLPWASGLERRGVRASWGWVRGTSWGRRGELEAAEGESVSKWGVEGRRGAGSAEVPATLGGCRGWGWSHSPGLSPQSSQPSTTSPFKQEVFVYSPSPSSESPSLAAAATPIIMSRSPTGRWHLMVCPRDHRQELELCPDHCSWGLCPRCTKLARFHPNPKARGP